MGNEQREDKSAPKKRATLGGVELPELVPMGRFKLGANEAPEKNSERGFSAAKEVGQ